MKMLWCWRCGAEMPMLDEQEFEVVTACAKNTRPIRERLQPVLDEYERITGLRETNPNAVYHHRLSLYGPPCAACGRPLRTPRAKLCGNCMHVR